MTLLVRRFEPSLRDDFFRLHSARHDCGWCCCVAWWVPTWDGWGERPPGENRRLRESLLDRGEYDGYLLYGNDEPVGWCQAGPRDRLEKLRMQFGLEPDPDTWAVTCFLIRPDRRRQGLARTLLSGVLDDLRARGVQRVEAFPKRVARPDALDLWNGPETLFVEAGFRVAKDDPVRPVLAKEL